MLVPNDNTSGRGKLDGRFGIVVVAVVYLAVAVLLYRNTINDWFLPDEIINISEVADLSFPEVLTHGESFGNFVPMLYVSLWVDWKLFGLHPMGYHLHSVTVSLLVAILAFVLMRQWLSWTRNRYLQNPRNEASLFFSY